MAVPSSNFAFLAQHDPLLVRLPTFAEKHFADDPNTCIIKLRQFSERLAQVVGARSGQGSTPGSGREEQFDLLGRLRSTGVVPPQTAQFFHDLRRHGNEAVHRGVGNHPQALVLLKVAHQLAVWFHRTFGDAQFKPGPFVPPRSSPSVEPGVQTEIVRLRAELATQRSAAASLAQQVEVSAQAASAAQARIAEAQARVDVEAAARSDAQSRAEQAEADARKLAEELETWRRLAEEAEVQFAAKLAALSAAPRPTPAQQYAQVARAEMADQALEINEADTRLLIDAQLREVGWEADTSHLTFRTGARPEAGRAQAISEWPTTSGPVDYALFVGLELVGVIEAKRRAKDVPGVLAQAKRYARDIRPEHGARLHRRAPWGEYRAPFVFATNGRPFLEQYRTKSGLWMWDARIPGEIEHPVAGGWMSPESLRHRLGDDPGGAAERLAADPLDALDLRDYQRDAIARVETAVLAGQRRILLAMATGTGKTRTAIGLMVRLLKSRRFGRILFLVDRNALGEQALEAVENAPIVQFQTFAKIYDVKGMDELFPEPETRLQIATIQAMIGRTLALSDGQSPIDPGTYDCIVVDECHRGYTLDRELSERELLFRSQDEYISKYRRVLDYFDAVAIGLTATPALHTAQIFGPPVYRYSYRQAVLDGMLVDHEPPYVTHTRLSTGGIHFAAGETVDRYNRRCQTVDTVNLPDGMDFEVEDFNRSVLTESWNAVVCGCLADEIDIDGPGKTLIFAASSEHADMVVLKLKEAYKARLGEVAPDAIVKITGDVDRPSQQIRNYKTERLPTIAVTVDLLTTGIDVPAICNLVFMRRVKSRILYEQMLGRATRRCDAIGKETFRVFDAVGLYAMMQEVSEMQPIAVDPQITVEQLVEELRTITDTDLRPTIHDQLIAKLRVRARRLQHAALRHFEELAGEAPTAVVNRLQEAGPDAALAWIDAHPAAFAALIARSQRDHGPLIAHHTDALIEVTRGYAGGKRPEDFLEDFGAFLRDNINRLPALAVVVQRPRELTRAQLREVLHALDAAGYSETSLRAAHRDLSNQDIAAKIVGFIRRQALGSPLEPYEARVDRALRTILARQAWTTPQREWISRIAKQLKLETVVDRDALDQGAFKSAGGFTRIDKVFDGKLAAVLGDLQDALWSAAS